MATLLELNEIEVNSTADPGGDPLADPPVPPDPDIVAARDLRARVRMAVVRRAGGVLVTPLPPADQTDARGDALDQLAWAQRVVASPETATSAVLRLALVRAPTAATTAGILGVTDQAIEDGITPLLALLVKGTGR